MNSFDLIVSGGGTAGVFAAITGARLGLRVLLVEKTGMLGGTATQGRVNFPGLFFAWGKQIISGPCWEAIERTCKLGGGKIPEISYKPEHHWLEQVNIDIFTYVHTLDQMCAEAGVTVLFHATVTSGRETASGAEVGVITKSGMRQYKAKAVIDATGDADFIRFAGFCVEESDVLQPATLINDIDGYTLEELDIADFEAKLEEAYKTGLLTGQDTQGNSLLSQLKSKRISMHIECNAPHTAEGRTLAEITARNTLFKIVTFLKTVKGLEGIYVSSFGNECGIRESVRIKGKATVTSEDYISGRHYDDGICFSFYPIDLHVPTGIKQIFLKEGIVPEIPAGALMPEGSKYVFACGRCISSDRDANSALRVQATASATGQAAAVLAFLVATKGITSDEISIEEAKKYLKESGAIVP